eukprot:Tamp_02381.p2 GENE.Tamp_02381~~Tamp_02381.p2  ORF type:complete len:212 (-),score=26.03 Tamp_02381:649-1284(-)
MSHTPYPAVAPGPRSLGQRLTEMPNGNTARAEYKATDILDASAVAGLYTTSAAGVHPPAFNEHAHANLHLFPSLHQEVAPSTTSDAFSEDARKLLEQQIYLMEQMETLRAQQEGVWGALQIESGAESLQNVPGSMHASRFGEDDKPSVNSARESLSVQDVIDQSRRTHNNNPGARGIDFYGTYNMLPSSPSDLRASLSVDEVIAKETARLG